MNGPVECRRIPPIRQKKGATSKGTPMGHGAFVGDPAAGSSLGVTRLKRVEMLRMTAQICDGLQRLDASWLAWAGA